MRPRRLNHYIHVNFIFAQVSKGAALILGLSFMGIQALSHAGYLAVDYTKVCVSVVMKKWSETRHHVWKAPCQADLKELNPLSHPYTTTTTQISDDFAQLFDLNGDGKVSTSLCACACTCVCVCVHMYVGGERGGFASLYRIHLTIFSQGTHLMHGMFCCCGYASVTLPRRSMVRMLRSSWRRPRNISPIIYQQVLGF